MFYKTIILLSVLSLSLLASDAKKKEIVDYSHFYINKKVSFYAGKVFMKNFDEDEAYSVGLLLHKNKKTKTEYGFGYLQPCTQIDSFLNTTIPKLDNGNQEGLIFFMNYNF